MCILTQQEKKYSFVNSDIQDYSFHFEFLRFSYSRQRKHTCLSLVTSRSMYRRGAHHPKIATYVPKYKLNAELTV